MPEQSCCPRSKNVVVPQAEGLPGTWQGTISWNACILLSLSLSLSLLLLLLLLLSRGLFPGTGERSDAEVR